MILDFAKNPILLETYSCFGKSRMHVGLLLEDLDVIAADVAFNFGNESRDPSLPPLNLVTVHAEVFFI